MSSIQQRIQSLKENGFSLDFASTFEDAFSIWGKLFLYGALATLILGLYYMVISFIGVLFPPYAEYYENLMNIINSNQGDFAGMMEALQGLQPNPDIRWIALLITVLMALIFPIKAGLINMAYQYDKNDDVDIAYLFAGFNGGKLGQLILLFLFYWAASAVLQSLVYIVDFGQQWESLIFLLLNTIPVVGFSIASCFVMLNHMKAMDAVKASFSLAFKKFFTVLFLLIFASIIGYLGVIICGVGLLFTYPLSTFMCYAIYKNIVGIENDEMDSIGNSYES